MSAASGMYGMTVLKNLSAPKLVCIAEITSNSSTLRTWFNTRSTLGELPTVERISNNIRVPSEFCLFGLSTQIR